MSEERFTIEDTEYFIKQPNANVLTKAQNVYAKTFNEACNSGAILKKSLDKHMRDQGLWDDSTEEKYQAMIKESAAIEHKIKSGQYSKASEIKQQALRLRELREDITEILSTRNSMDSLTAEGVADNARFNFLLANCVFAYATQKPVFESMDDYLEKSTTPLSIKLATKFASVIYGLDENYEEELFETKVLRKLNCLDADGHLVNKDGKRVDIEGNLIDDTGARIDENGNRIDINNNPILDDSVLDTLEFEDDLA